MSPALVRTLTLFFLPLLVVAWICTSVVPAVPAFAEDDPSAEVTWGVRTSDNELGSQRRNYAYTVAPGAAVADAMTLTNHSEQAIDLDLYPADAFTTTSGQLDVLAADQESKIVGTWIALETDRIHLEPGASQDVPFTVTVPQNATPGDHAGGIVSVLAVAPREDGISVDRRLGIRVHVRVDGPFRPELSVEDLRVEYHPTLNPFSLAGASVSYTVRNSGNTRLSSAQSVALSAPFGLFRYDIDGVDPVPELLPGETWRVEAHSDRVLPLFWLTATATLAPRAPDGMNEVADPAMFETSLGTLALPWSQLALLLLLGGLVAATIVIRSRRRTESKAAEDARVKAAVEAALRERDQADGTTT